MAVFAPFRFAPIHRWVHFPEWASLVSHDVPFRDGLSGSIEFGMRAETPFLIGGARREPNEKQAGEVWPYQLPDGRWAIPPSSLQGMVRSILEIATFARLGPWIDNKRFGIRDLTRPAEPYYQRRLSRISGVRPVNVEPQVCAGWLRREPGTDEFHFKSCSFARIEFEDLSKLTMVPVEKWRRERQAAMRYGLVLASSKLDHALAVEPEQTKPHLHRDRTLSIAYRKVTGLSGPKNGQLVLTGNPSPNKHMEFFFFDETAPTRLPDFRERFDEFLSIHEPNDGRSHNPSWAYFKKKGYGGGPSFDEGGWMPIFYLPSSNGGIESFGLAFMFKLAHKKTTGDLLSNSSIDHMPKGADPRADFPSLIFGSKAGSSSNIGLKRRAAFDTAVATLADGATLVEPDHPSVLLSPKPSYFPIYIRQPESGVRGKLPSTARGRSVAYATYTPIESKAQYPDFDSAIQEHTEPQLSGVKIWPVKSFQIPPVDREISGNRKVQTLLRPLPAGTRFDNVRLRFHNLLPEELGALVWALTFNDVKALSGEFGSFRHRLGMGKPYGLGQLSIRISGHEIVQNEGTGRPTLEGLTSDFVQYMDRICLSKGAVRWFETPQVKALVRAADPLAQENEKFEYMKLGGDDGENPDSYIGARAHGWFLPAYVADNENEGPGQIRGSRGARPTGRPRLDARVRRKDGRAGTIVEEPKDTRSPQWRILWDGESKPMWLREFAFEVIG